jgi:hypothetical protein
MTGWWVAESLDADAAGQATFYGCLDKIGREEGERLCGRSSVLAVILGALSPHPKIPFPAAEARAGLIPTFGATIIRDS